MTRSQSARPHLNAGPPWSACAATVECSHSAMPTFLLHRCIELDAETVDQRRGLSSGVANKATHTHPKDENQLELCFELSTQRDQDQTQVRTPWVRFTKLLSNAEKEGGETWAKLTTSSGTTTPQSKAKTPPSIPTSSPRGTPTKSCKEPPVSPEQVWGKAGLPFKYEGAMSQCDTILEYGSCEGKSSWPGGSLIPMGVCLIGWLIEV